MNNVKNTIGWADYTINPIKGLCKGGCSYCYARKTYKRFQLDPEVRFVPEAFDKIAKLKKPARIFLCSTHDIMGNWIPDEWVQGIINLIDAYPQHTFLLLTKCPSRIADFEYPKNVWLGQTTVIGLIYSQSYITNNINFISIEPMQGYCQFPSGEYNIPDWIIIGSQTQPYKPPEIAWIIDIMRQAKELKIPVYMKSNLKKVCAGKRNKLNLQINMVQEFPQSNNKEIK